MADPTSHEAQASADARGPVRCAVLTVSDSRTVETDQSGPIIRRLLTDAGHQAVDCDLVPDEPDDIRRALQRWLDDPNVDAILITGGTGVGRRDTTIEIVRQLIDVELEGFGELFRMLSYEQVKAAAMLSRAVGGLARGDRGGDTFVFSMPGSTNAVELAMNRLIVPQLAHLVWERRRD